MRSFLGRIADNPPYVRNNCILAASDEQTEHAAKCMVRHLVWHTDAKIVSNAEDKHVKEWRIELATSNSPAKLVLEQQRYARKRRQVPYNN